MARPIRSARATWGRRRYSATVLRATPHLRPIWRLVSPQAHSGGGSLGPCAWTVAQRPRMPSWLGFQEGYPGPETIQRRESLRGSGYLRGTSLRVAGFSQNRWPACSGMGGRLGQSGWPVWSGARMGASRDSPSLNYVRPATKAFFFSGSKTPCFSRSILRSSRRRILSEEVFGSSLTNSTS